MTVHNLARSTISGLNCQNSPTLTAPIPRPSANPWRWKGPQGLLQGTPTHPPITFGNIWYSAATHGIPSTCGPAFGPAFGRESPLSYVRRRVRTMIYYRPRWILVLLSSVHHSFHP